ncbi:hemerythrin domain-containing protein [Dehalobacterium formicoaceticum]|uniref:hemerythrin domain-containing protein n=1 Tax=Dehalobacterium formicoaceticum TaxID=51515 RepID=UPI000B7DA04D|nr:hemerythrin domain-containing protein [Dehalobacterium formicoaceticum]
MMGQATKDLINEHNSILHVLEILDKMMADQTKAEDLKLRYYDELVYFLKIFADKCHHGKEENYLFKELISKGDVSVGGSVSELLQEHDLARSYIGQMNQALAEKSLVEFNKAAVQYRDLLRNHIDKENNDLFVIADRLFDDAFQDEMFEKFEQFEEEVIGHGVHEKLHHMIHKWSEEFAG